MHRLYDYKNAFRILKGGKISLVVSAFLATTTLVHASPSGGDVTSGNANISQNGNITNINQSTQKATINWQKFDISKNETVNFNQPNKKSVTLNRVVGASNSVIQGAMNANGQVILVNQNGVVFSEGSQVNVGGIVATTKNIKDEDFQNGNYKFEGDSSASIINKGNIKAKYVAMMGKEVINEGRIEATLGRVELAGGNKFSLNINGDSLLKLTIEEGTLNALVKNKGIIKADGGKVYLTTQALDSILDGMVNNTGIIEAQSLSTNEKGEVVLFAHGGTADIGGEIKAEGGFVETSGKNFKIQPNATIKAKEWLIDPVNITIDSTLAGTISTALGSGDVTVTTQGSNTPSTTSGESGTDGDIKVNSEISWASANDLTLHAHRDIYINADITATHSAAKLILEYGQGAVAAGNISDYYLNGGHVNLQAGQNFDTKLGNDGVITNWSVITSLGNAIDATSTPSIMTLQGIRTLPSGNYVLGSNIDASETSTWNSNGSGGYYGFSKIGSGSTAPNVFSGKFDGLGHSINNLYIKDTAGAGSNNGLFGYTLNASIHNLSLINANITGYGSVGALIGSASNTDINNIYVSGQINGGMNYVGGIVGFFVNSILNDSYSTAKVTAPMAVGGLVGDLAGGTVSNSYATGEVSATMIAIAGGAFGYLENTPTITNVYFDSTTTGQQYLIGGGTDTTGAIANADAYTQASYSGFDFTNDWFMVDGYTRPFLRMEATNNITNAHELQMMSSKLGSGNVISYKLANDIDLAPSLTNKSEMWKDTSASIDYADYQGSFVPVGYRAGSRSTYNFFGSFDGQNHTIENLYINRPTNVRGTDAVNAFLGLFGEVNGGEFKDFSLTNASITGYDTIGVLMGSIDNIVNISNINIADATLRGGNQIGGLAGQDGWNSTISDVTISNIDIVSTGDTVGGILGYSAATQLLNSSAFGSVSAANGMVGGLIGSMESDDALVSGSNSSVIVSSSAGTYVGGLVGAIDDDASIVDSYATGSVTGSSKVGGLVGGQVWPNHIVQWLRDNGRPVSISNSYATGSVFGTQYVGGLVGALEEAGSTITNSQATGTVTGDDYVGGLVGYSEDGLITNSYATGNVIGTNGSEGVGGFIGDNGGTIKDSYATGSVIVGEESFFIGGFAGDNVGRLTTATISRSYATGNVVSGSLGGSIGGFAGNNQSQGHETTIEQSYSTGSVTVGNESILIGGFVGSVLTLGEDSIIKNSYSRGSLTVEDTNQYIGGFAGVIANQNGPDESRVENSYATGSLTVGTDNTNYGGFSGSLDAWGTGTAVSLNNFWDKDAVGIDTDGTNGTAVGKTTSQMKRTSIYNNANWDIATPLAGYLYPTLIWGANGDAIWQTYATQISVTAPTVASKTYDGSTTAQITVGTVTGLNDQDTATVSATGTFNDKNAGSNKTVTINYTINGGDAIDFILPVQATLTNQTIGKKTLTIGGADNWLFANDKTYDGNANTTVDILFGLGMASLNGLVGSETIDVTADGEFANANAGNNKDVDVSFNLANGTNGGLASNYEIANITKQANILKKYITVAGNFTANNKVYDGNTNATFATNNIVLDGVVVGEELTLSNLGLEFLNKNAGNGKTVRLTGGAIASTQNGNANNYVFTLGEVPPTTTANITKKVLTIDGTIAQDKIYDGTTNATVNLGTLNGLIGNETLNNSVIGTFNSKDVGNRTVSILYTLTNGANGGLASNYILANSTDEAVINKANLSYTVTSDNKSYGQSFTLPIPSFTGGTPTGTTTVKVYNSNNVDVTEQATAGTLDVGTYTVKTLINDSNYELATNGNTDGTLVINKANVNYSLEGQTLTSGEKYLLPTPNLVGGTPSGKATVKIYDEQNIDVTEQALAGTLKAGKYIVKTVDLEDINYQLATSGNTDGILTINQNVDINSIVTNIVNNAIKNNIPVTTLIQPKIEVQNGFEKRVNSTIINNTPNVGNDKSLGRVNLGLNEVIRSVNPSINNVAKDTKLTVVGETAGESKIATVELADLVAKSGGGELRVALSPDSFVELVNGGVTLPEGVSQEFYVVEDKK